MRHLLLIAALAAAWPAAAAPPPAAERAITLRVTLPLAGGADRPAWRPLAPRPPARFSGSDVAKNLAEGWWGIGILAVGAGVWLYQERTD